VAGRVLRVAWLAGRGDRAGARREFRMAWQLVLAEESAAARYAMPELAEVVIAAGLVDETRTALSFWELRPSPLPQPHFALLRLHAAPLLGEREVADPRPSFRRSRQTAAAIRAELDGDRERAIAGWREIIAEPSDYWEPLPRMALARNLRALGRVEELAGVCAELAHPPIFRAVYLPLRRTCRDWGLADPPPQSASR
jgi:hypothetical protein